MTLLTVLLLVSIVLAVRFCILGATNLRVQLAGDIVFGPSNAEVASSTAFAELINEPVAAQTLEQFNINFPVTSKLECLLLYCDVDIEVQLNSSSGLPGTGASVIYLLAGVPAMWYPGCGYTLSDLVGSDAVTTIYAYVPGTTAATKFNVRVQYNSTP